MTWLLLSKEKTGQEACQLWSSDSQEEEKGIDPDPKARVKKAKGGMLPIRRFVGGGGCVCVGVGGLLG